MPLKEDWEDDRDPLAALRAGDPGPFERFVRQEIPTFLGFFQRLGASRTEAEDRVQELLLKLYQHARTYQRQGRFAAYAFRVARNLMIDRTRRRALREEAQGVGEEDEVVGATLERLADDSVGDPLADLARSEQVARLRAALARLPDHHRLVFELGVVQELPYQEIGDVLDVPVGTVKSRMFHAVRKLRDALDEGQEGEEA